MLKWLTTLNIVIRNKTGSFFNCAELWLNIRPTTLLYFNVDLYGGSQIFSEVVLGIKDLRTTDGKQSTISSDANYLIFFFLFHSFEWKVGLSFR